MELLFAETTLTLYLDLVLIFDPSISSKNAVKTDASVPKLVPVTVILVFSTGEALFELKPVIVIALESSTNIYEAALANVLYFTITSFYPFDA